MPIYKGVNKIGAIYKGSTKIDKVYKGSILVYSSAYWLAYSFEPLYNSLIPTTISGKQVKDKAKLTVIEGNSEVVNQLLENGNFELQTSWAKWLSSVNFTIANNIAKCVMVSPSGGAFDGFYQNRSVLLNHKYIVKFKARSSTSNAIRVSLINSNSLYMKNTDFDLTTSFQQFSLIWEITSTSTYTSTSQLNFAFKSNAVANNEFEVMEVNMIDLTQAYPFDTPTSLDDPRVQKIINGGYIEYNTGEIKNVDVGEISSEPFNIWDEEVELGKTLDSSTGAVQTQSGWFVSKNYISVISNKTYYFKVGGSGDYVNNFRIACYDENKTYLGISSGWFSPANNTVTIPSNCKYIKFRVNGATYNNDICINRSSSLNGTYKPYKQPVTLSFIYQGSGVGTAHDSMEITDTEYVFTKKMSEYNDISSLSFGANEEGTNTYRFAVNFSQALSNGYGLCDKFKWITTGFSIDSESVGVINNLLIIRIDKTKLNSIYTSEAFHNWLVANKTSISYELATPQVIRIPKKHLGIVDLGSLSWSALGSGVNDYAFSNGIASLVKKPESYSVLSNIYSSNYLSETGSHVYLHSVPKCICITVDGSIGLYDANLVGKTGAEIAAALSGVYLFYETEGEVQDIATEISIEAGGTLTSNSEVLPNIDTLIKTK